MLLLILGIVIVEEDTCDGRTPVGHGGGQYTLTANNPLPFYKYNGTISEIRWFSKRNSVILFCIADWRHFPPNQFRILCGSATTSQWKRKGCYCSHRQRPLFCFPRGQETLRRMDLQITYSFESSYGNVARWPVHISLGGASKVRLLLRVWTYVVSIGRALTRIQFNLMRFNFAIDV